ncbi:helix-turn-helix domain-containing protein [Saccharopolyspora indica]|uniref:helix-turn-helix domain-containing protein n=1 Tax=Saccharopolyspora indica TaxID=1229659 RepID=UPI0022EADCA9|nr:helix-turn-helix transcriptional regulator [Saccharopolyspora indica]MDA3643832.1 helix-turn-helix transcriptional regulator [Saccharopolyspora indica]
MGEQVVIATSDKLSRMSTARQRQLGSWLTKLRKQAGLDVDAAAEVLGCSVSKIRHLEAGRAKVKKAELDRLLAAFEAPAEVRHHLNELRSQAEQRGWWHSYKLPSWFEPYVDFEQAATEVCNFELDLVPGLLQTEAYAREIHRVGRSQVLDIDRFVSARMERQRRLLAESPLQLRAVVGESALRRLVGGPDVMREQIERLIDRCQLPNVILQVLPFGAGAHVCPSSAFVVLAFAADEEPIGYMDSPLGGHTVDEAEDVTVLRYLFDGLRATALPAAASLELLRSIAIDISNS